MALRTITRLGLVPNYVVSVLAIPFTKPRGRSKKHKRGSVGYSQMGCKVVRTWDAM